MAKALRQLRPKVARFFPALEEAEPVGVTSGVSQLSLPSTSERATFSSEAKHNMLHNKPNFRP